MKIITRAVAVPLRRALAGVGLGILFVFFPVISQSATDPLEVKTVVSDGLGADVPSAAQNAAQNALINVVGSFMDSTKLLEKRVEIQEGVRSQTSRIDTNIKEYSQGSIQSFEVLSVSQQAGLTKVTAKVSVRVEDFKAYIKKLATGDVEVAGASLFAQAATETKQVDNKAALLYENVIAPIVSGKVIEFNIGTPRPIGTTKWTGDAVEAMTKEHGKENVFLITVTESLNQEFLANLKTTLNSISQKKTIYLSKNDFGQGATFEISAAKTIFTGKVTPQQNDVLLLFNNGKADIAANDDNTVIPSELYLVTNVREKLRLQSDWSKSLFESNSKEFPMHDLHIILLDGNDVVLQEETALARRDSNYETRRQQHNIFIGNADYTHYYYEGFFGGPWLMLMGADDTSWSKWNDGWSGSAISIFEKRSFVIILAIKPEALANTKKIRINLVE